MMFRRSESSIRAPLGGKVARLLHSHSSSLTIVILAGTMTSKVRSRMAPTQTSGGEGRERIGTRLKVLRCESPREATGGDLEDLREERDHVVEAED